MLYTLLNRNKNKLNKLNNLLLRNNSQLPSQARAIVVGGGIIGNSVAYHLASMGMKDVILLEKHQITSGTTWHAAGLMVTFGSFNETSTDMRKYTKNLYSKILEEETGHSTGFKPVGFIEIASDKDRLIEYRRIAAINRRHGVDVHEITPKEILEKFPLCKIDDVLAGFYVKDDGRVNPVDATVAFSKAAKQKGVKIYEGITVDNIIEKEINGHRKIEGVITSTGDIIKSEYVINCTGMWARQFGENHKVIIPNQAAEHYYVITDAMKNVDPNWPVLEDPANYAYYRPEGGGLMVGLFEPIAATWNTRKIPSDFAFGEIQPDWERMQPYLEAAMSRIPATLTAGIKTFFCGPESFTPDLAPCVGESPEIKNYFIAAGLNSIGILTGGGIGRVLAHWIVNKRPDVDITGFNIDRLHAYQANPRYRAERVVESLGNVYKCHYPYKVPQTARGAKHTPIYDRAVKLGAYFRAVSGFETADWYEHNIDKNCFNLDNINNNNNNNINNTNKDKNEIMIKHQPNKHLSNNILKKHLNYTWDRPSFWLNWQYEHNACRNGVVLIDMSFMSKFLVQGRNAAECLNYLCTADIDGPIGTITYTQCLNENGLMEADITVSKLDNNKFMVIATDTAHRHVETFLRRNLDPNGIKHVTISDMTGAYSQLNIQGPQSRLFMQYLVDGTFPTDKNIEKTDSMSNDNFPFRKVEEMAIGLARANIARITYVGELGYELHIPTEFTLHVHDCIMKLKEEWDKVYKETPLVHCGLKALGSLRMEKAYRDYGHDMDNLDTLLEVGLGFTADMKKKNGFLGKSFVEKQQKELKELKGLSRRLCQILCLDSEPMLFHGEIIRRNGIVCGDIRVGTYGHTLKGAIGLAMIETIKEGEVINKEYIDNGKWDIEVAGKFYPIQVSLNPLYDPKNLRIKA